MDAARTRAENATTTKKRRPAAKSTLPAITADSPDRFINRELSWLAFNERVLNEADNKHHPLFEQLRFLSISANNLNEFYMVRVAGLRGQVKAGIDVPSQEGLTPRQQLALVNRRAGILMENQQKCWARICEALADEGVHVLAAKDITAAEKRWLKRYFI